MLRFLISSLLNFVNPKNENQRIMIVTISIPCKVAYLVISVRLWKWKKDPYTFFSTFGSKINEIERKKYEKNKKIQKKLKVAGNYPNI